MFKKIILETKCREEILDITSYAQELVFNSETSEGLLYLFCTHTTCGLTINESADPAVKRDLVKFFRSIAPQCGWEHMEGNTDAHIRSSLLGSFLLLPVENSRLVLGAWQAIYFYEGDGPRRRTILAKIICQDE